MNIQTLIIFIILNIVNVIIQTVKSIATIKCSKGIAALVNAIAYGLYTVVLVWTMADLPLYLKAVIVAFCNLVGVYTVKYLEEKSRKDKLWKVEATLPTDKEDWMECLDLLKDSNVPCNFIDINKYIIINCFCATQDQSLKTKNILDAYGAKYFVSESKVL